MRRADVSLCPMPAASMRGARAATSAALLMQNVDSCCLSCAGGG